MPELRLAGAPVSSHKGDVFVKAKSYQDSWHKLIATLFEKRGCIGLPRLERSSGDTRDAPRAGLPQARVIPHQVEVGLYSCCQAIVAYRHRVTPSGQFGVLYKMHLGVLGVPLQESW